MRRAGDVATAALLGAALGALTVVVFGAGQAMRWDNSAHNVPLSYEVYRQWLAGMLPAWNPFLWSGTPLLADPQSLPFYLPMHAAYAIARDPVVAVRVAIGTHVAWATTGTWLLARSLGASRAGGTVAGTAFALHPWGLNLATGFLNMYMTASWLPWMLLAVHRGVAGERPRGALVLAALATAGAWHAGYPQYWIYGALAVVGLAPFLPGSRGRRALWLPAAALVLGLGLAAIQIVPFFSLWSESQRTTVVEQSQRWAVPPLGILGVLVPGWFAGSGARSHVASLVYVGTTTAVLAAIAACRASAPRRALAALAVLGLWLATGAAGGLSPLLLHVPVLRLFRGPVKFMLWPMLGVALLAGLGVDDLTTRPRRRHALVLLLAGCAAAALFATVTPVDLAGEVARRKVALAVALGGTVVLGTATWLAARGASGAGRAIGGLAALAALAVGTVGLGVYRHDEPRWLSTYGKPPRFLAGGVGPPAFEADWLRSGGWRSYWGISLYRRAAHDSLGGALGALWRIEMTSGYSALYEPFYGDTIGYFETGQPMGGGVQRVTATANAALEVLSNRYTVVHPDPLLRAAVERQRNVNRRRDWIPVDDSTAIVLHRDALPRARFVRRVQRVSTRAQAVRALSTLNPIGLAAVLEGGEEPVRYRGRCTGTADHLRPGAIDMQVACTHPGFAIFAERWDPGWEATIDGRPATVERVFGIVLGLEVPADAERIELRYAPPHFVAGAATSAGAAVLCLLLVAVPERRRVSGEQVQQT